MRCTANDDAITKIAADRRVAVSSEADVCAVGHRVASLVGRSRARAQDAVGARAATSRWPGGQRGRPL
jgi:hypothetical protein